MITKQTEHSNDVDLKHCSAANTRSICLRHKKGGSVCLVQSGAPWWRVCHWLAV